MSSSTSVSAQYTRQWLEVNFPDSETEDQEQYLVEHSEGFTSRLYTSCRTVFQGVCTRLCIGAREELAKLYLWGQSFGPGELDIAVDYSDDEHSVVLDALGCIGQLLLDEISRLCAAPRFADLDAQAQELNKLVEQSRVIISSQEKEDEDASSDDSADTSISGSSDHEETSDFTQELKPQIDRLVQLGPSLRENVLYARKSRVEASVPPVVPFHLSGPAWKYVMLVRERYENAEDQLVNRLGEANWQRHELVRERMEAIQRRTSDDNESRLDDTPFYNSRDDLYSAFRPYSTFHDSGIGTSIPEDALSHTSFLSSNPERGSLRVPAAPEEVGAGKPFQCPFCGDTLRNITSRIGWKMHVFADLRPYICTFAKCNKELAQFTTRAAWADHEFTEHRIIRSWSCPECTKQCESEQEWDEHLEECHQQTFSGPKYQVALSMACNTLERTVDNEACPLCQVTPGTSRGEFVKHVGRHMEEIALMALPLEDEDTEADEQRSSTASSPSLTFEVGDPESNNTGSWFCCVCFDGPQSLTLALACVNCSRPRCSRCAIGERDWRPWEIRSPLPQEGFQDPSKAPRQSSPELKTKLSSEKLHAIKYGDEQSERQVRSFIPGNATQGEVQPTKSPFPLLPGVMIPPAKSEYMREAVESDKQRAIESSINTKMWAANDSLSAPLSSLSAPGRFPSPLASDLYLDGSYLCEHPGCTAVPFQTQYLLNSHANVHSQNRPHYCPVKGCSRSEGGKGFKRKNEMIRHGLVHRSPGYICPFCPEREHKYPRPENLQRHVRVNHPDKDMNDPLLRAVLDQRTERGSRGRVRTLGRADEQQQDPSETHISPKSSTTRQTLRTLDEKPHTEMSLPDTSRSKFQRGDIVRFKTGPTAGMDWDCYSIDGLIAPTKPSQRNSYHIVSMTVGSISRVHEDELEYYTEAQDRSDDAQNQVSAETAPDTPFTLEYPLDYY